MEIHATTLESPIGELAIALRPEGVVWIGRDAVAGEAPHVAPPKFDREVGKRIHTVRWVWEDTPDVTAPVVDALRRYFHGDPEAFATIPVAPVGTDFQLKVWEACHQIPFGKTCTYGELATAIGNPQAARAIGGAMNRNPVPLIVPCHRVVGAGGKMVGYGMGGTRVKEWLLSHERRS